MTTRARDIQALNQALANDDPNWAYFRMLSAADKEAMDAILIERAHPLAYEPGTREHRFRTLHRTGFRF